MDLGNYSGTLNLAVSFVTQWLFFHFGFGVIGRDASFAIDVMGDIVVKVGFISV